MKHQVIHTMMMFTERNKRKKTEAYKIETTMKYVFSVHSNRWKTGFFREEYVYMETVSQAEKRLTHTHGEVTEKEVHT